MKSNKFFDFVETYKDDITAFVKALIDFIKTIFGSDEEAAE